MRGGSAYENHEKLAKCRLKAAGGEDLVKRIECFLVECRAEAN